MAKGLNRRDFLKGMAAGAGACCASTLMNNLSFTICPAASAASGGKVIVALYLNGGPDFIDWLYWSDPALNSRRPTLNLTGTGLDAGENNLLWNPQLTGFKSELDAGNLAAINFVAPNNHSGSHEVARGYWNNGQSSGVGANQPKNGWFGRMLDDLGAESNFACFNLASLSITQGTTSVTNGSLGSFGWDQSGGDAEKARNTLFALSSQFSGGGEQAEDLIRSYTNAEGAVQRVQEAINGTTFTQQYQNNQTGRAFRDAHRIIANFPETCAIVIQRGGHDTHGNQRNGNNNTLSEINNAITTFLANMRAMGKGDDVVVYLYGEFGRQVTENATQGTDHGRAGSVFVFGDSVNGGIYGPDWQASLIAGKNYLPAEVNTNHVLGPLAQWMGANPNNLFVDYNAGSALSIL